MIRNYLIAALLGVLVIHYLTPSWMLTDLNQFGDWVVMFFFAINILVSLKVEQRLDKKILLLCIISSFVFVLLGTTQGEEVTSSSIRLFEAIKIDYNPTPTIASATGIVSLIAFFAFFILALILSVKAIKQLMR